MRSLVGVDKEESGDARLQSLATTVDYNLAGYVTSYMLDSFLLMNIVDRCTPYYFMCYWIFVIQIAQLPICRG